MYHYVRDLKASAYPEIKGLDLPLFINQLEYVKRNYQVVKMEDVVESVTTGSRLPDNAVLLTFDDGYIDHFEHVLPWLKKYDFQGSFFVPAQTVKEHKVLDVNKIHFILASVSDKHLIVNDLEKMLGQYKEEHGLFDFDHYYSKLAIANRFDPPHVIFIKRLLQVELEESLRAKMTQQLFETYVGMAEEEFSKQLYMSIDQLKIMLDEGMHIGCHGYNHYWWNRLDAHTLDTELDQSLAFLNELGVELGAWTAAYPYGSHSPEVEEKLDEKGCKLAFTTVVGKANLEDNTRLTLPRFDTNDLPKTI